MAVQPNLPTAPRTNPTYPTPHALRLGYLGLVPFVLGVVFVGLLQSDAHAQQHNFVISALSKYAAVIISFLAGIHWGLAMRGGAPKLDDRLTWGVVPSLVAWIAVVMSADPDIRAATHGVDAGLVVHGVTLIVCYLNDRKHYPSWGAAAWLTLRFRLTVVASLSCFLAAAWS